MVLHPGALFPTFWGVLFLEQALRTYLEIEKFQILFNFKIWYANFSSLGFCGN